MKVDTRLTDCQLVEHCAAVGIRIRALSDYCHHRDTAQDSHCLVVNYSGLTDDQLIRLEEILKTAQ